MKSIVLVLCLVALGVSSENVKFEENVTETKIMKRVSKIQPPLNETSTIIPEAPTTLPNEENSAEPNPSLNTDVMSPSTRDNPLVMLVRIYSRSFAWERSDTSPPKNNDTDAMSPLIRANRTSVLIRIWQRRPTDQGFYRASNLDIIIILAAFALFMMIIYLCLQA